jgi:WD40 repeat protein
MLTVAMRLMPLPYLPVPTAMLHPAATAAAAAAAGPHPHPHTHIQECTSRVNSIDFHRNHDLLVSAGDDDTIHVYDTAEGRHVASIPSNKYGCQNIVWTHAPDKVVFASNKVSTGSSSSRSMSCSALTPVLV